MQQKDPACPRSRVEKVSLKFEDSGIATGRQRSEIFREPPLWSHLKCVIY